jgi:hypothetical protein
MSVESTWPDPSLSDEEHISLCETLDRVLNKGVVVMGEVVISVADVDLIYLCLQVVLTSVETAQGTKTAAPVHLGARAECRA